MASVKTVVSVLWISAKLCLAAERLTLFELAQGLDNVTCDANNTLFAGNQVSVLVCAKICGDDTSCEGFVFRDSDGACMGCKTEPVVVMAGTRAYGRTNRKWGFPCTTDSECADYNQICLDGKCACVAGYRFDYTVWSCVDACTTYGSTYQRYVNRSIFSLDYQLEFGVPLDQCLQLCSDGQTCRSVDFKRQEQTCILSNVTVLDVSEAYIYAPEFDYYNRNCKR